MIAKIRLNIRHMFIMQFETLPKITEKANRFIGHHEVLHSNILTDIPLTEAIFDFINSSSSPVK